MKLLKVRRSFDTGVVKQMLNIQIDNPEMEKTVRQTCADDSQARIRQDINRSIRQLDAGEGLPLVEVMEGIRSKYE